MNKYTVLFLIIIIGIAGLLRFWDLGKNPPSLTWDEVAWGYNAYTLGIDGKDEFGRFLPYDYLESFGDFKPPVYAYLAIVPIKLFGLNEFAVRFPSAFFGFLTVFVTFFLTKQIFYKSNNRIRIALLASLFLAVSPWHIMLSKAAFEANVASFFIVTGIYLFIQGVYRNSVYFLLSAIVFVLSFYTFNTPRIVVPLLVGALGVGFYKELWRQKGRVLISGLVGLILLLPIVPFLLSPEASLRFKEVNIFSDIDIIKITNQEIENDNNAWWSKLIHNRRLQFSVEYIKHYLDHFNPKFLFISGDVNPRFSTQDVGQMYLWDMLFFGVGILFLFRKREGLWWILPVWLLIGIIPAATARETPHALRIETTLPVWQILTAYGVAIFIEFVRSSKQISRYIQYISIFLGIVLALNVLYYLHGYFTHYPREYSSEWQYGYKESIEFVKRVNNDYDKVYITSELGRPYIYYLFYMKMSPSKFRDDSIVKRDVFGFVEVERIDKVIFTRDLPTVKENKRILYINVPAMVPKDAKILNEFRLLNGQSTLIAYTL